MFFDEVLDEEEIFWPLLHVPFRNDTASAGLAALFGAAKGGGLAVAVTAGAPGGLEQELADAALTASRAVATAYGSMFFLTPS